MQTQCVCSICYSILYGECTTEEPSACDVWQVPIWHHFVLQVDTTYTFISDLRIIVPVGAAQAPYSIVQVHIGELYTNHMFTRMVIGTISAHTYIQLYIDIMQLQLFIPVAQDYDELKLPKWIDYSYTRGSFTATQAGYVYIFLSTYPGIQCWASDCGAWSVAFGRFLAKLAPIRFCWH